MRRQAKAPSAFTHGRSTAAAILALAFLSLLALAPAANAVPKYVHRVVAEGPGKGAGQIDFDSLFMIAGDIAVNSASAADGTTDPLGNSADGYVYVLDSSNDRIQAFDDAGEFQFMWGQGVLNGAATPQVCSKADPPCTGRFTGTLGGAFNDPQGLAVDQGNGHVFVNDPKNLRVQEFTAAGQFVRAWGWDVVQEGTPNDTLTDQFETCFDAAECKKGSSGAGLGQFASAFFGNGTGIDVQQSSGEVFVSDLENRRIHRFGVPVSATDPITALGAFGSAAQFESNIQPANIAIDDDGILYASDGNEGSGNGNQIERYDIAASTFLSPISIAATTANATAAATRGLEIDPISGNLFVARDVSSGSGRFSPVYELANPGAANPATVTLADTHVAGTNIAWRGIGLDPATDTLYLGGEGAKHWILAANDGPLPLPDTIFLPYSEVETTSAKVNFEIDTKGLEFPVSYEVRLANADTPSDFQVKASGQVAGSASPVPVSASVSGLNPASTYLVRVVTAKPFNNPGTTEDNPEPLETGAVAPLLSDVRADQLQPTSARLTARINPRGTLTSYRFEWGQGDFANSVPAPDAALGEGDIFEFVAEQLTGLSPNTGYQFRLIATSADNSLAPVVSDTGTFTTPASSPGTRAFEMVSPPDKAGGQGLGFWPWGLGHIASAGVAAHTGERFMLVGAFGTSLSDDSAFGMNTELMFAERQDSQQGWKSVPVLSRPDYQPVLGKFFQGSVASDDLSSIAWAGPSSLVVFPEMAGPSPFPGQPNWSQFNPGLLSHWDGTLSGPTRWELFGPRGLSPDEIVSVADLSDTRWAMALSADGSTAYGATGLSDGKLPVVHGLAGPSDPTHPSTGELIGGRSIYAADLSGGLSDTYAGVGERELVNVCTGDSGSERTTIPSVGAGGDLEAAECPAGNGGRERLISDRGAAYSSSTTQALYRAVSRDGSRVFFLSPDPLASGVPVNGCTGTGPSSICPPQLYVRQRNDDGSVVTRWVSKAESGLFGTQDASLSAQVRFEGAARDGSVVYFRTNAPLTADDPNGGAPVPGGVKTGTPHANSWDLYRFELAEGNDPTGPGSALTRVSAGPNGEGDCNSPLSAGSASDNDEVGTLRFLSDDGDRAYFTCAAPLPGVSASGNGTITTPGGTATTTSQTNLYLFDANLPTAERRRFVARLPRSATGSSLDACASTGVRQRSGFDGGNGYHPNIVFQGLVNCVRGTADGSFITLFTPGRLTADDPVEAPGANVVADIYGYDAVADELTRITAPQGGEETPYGCQTDDPSSDSPQDESLVYSCRGDLGVDAQIGSLSLEHLGVAVEPLIAGDRIAFFNSASKLVPSDQDTGYDVYEWRNGSLNLITSGSPDSEHALYKGNDRTGRDLYLVTRDALTWQDSDAVTDVYSARVGGGIAEPVTPPACELLSGACKPPAPAAPTPSGASSTVISGEGNVVVKAGPKRCRKGKVRRGKRCVSKPKKAKKGASRQKRAASQTGRAGR